MKVRKITGFIHMSDGSVSEFQIYSPESWDSGSVVDNIEFTRGVVNSLAEGLNQGDVPFEDD